MLAKDGKNESTEEEKIWKTNINNKGWYLGNIKKKKPHQFNNERIDNQIENGQEI